MSGFDLDEAIQTRSFADLVAASKTPEHTRVPVQEALQTFIKTLREYEPPLYLYDEDQRKRHERNRVIWVALSLETTLSLLARFVQVPSPKEVAWASGNNLAETRRNAAEMLKVALDALEGFDWQTAANYTQCARVTLLRGLEHTW